MGWQRNKKTGEWRFVPDGAASNGIPPNPQKVEKGKADIRGAVAGAQSSEATAENTRRTIRQNPISKEDAERINAMRELNAGIPESLQMYDDAVKVVDRFKPSPNRAAKVRSALPSHYVKPGEKPGLWANLQASLVQSLMGIPDRDVSDYQEIDRLTNIGISQKQLAQKGPQTESDAMRLGLAGLSPDKSTDQNALIAGQGIFQGLMAEQKPGFYSRWANKYGSIDAVAPDGETVDDAWSRVMSARRDRLNTDPRIKRLREPGKPTSNQRNTGKPWYSLPNAPQKDDDELTAIKRKYGVR